MSIAKEFFMSFMEDSIREYKDEQKDCRDNRERPAIKELALTGHDKKDLGISGTSTPFHVNKRWGGEKIYQNNDLYCAKLLTIKPNCCTSMHFHLEKHETMINVGEGILYIDYVVDKKLKTIGLDQWESFVIAPGLPHRLYAKTKEVKLIEASTTSHDDDSIRLPEE